MLLFLLSLFSFCTPADKEVTVNTTVYKADTDVLNTDTTYHIEADSVYPAASTDTGSMVRTGVTKPLELVAFAQTLRDIPYKYGSIDPAQGFDCSGFVSYVFNHFGIQVPRSSVDFDSRNVQTVSLSNAKPGDLILFTGTDSTKKVVGHMGIIISNPAEGLKFIHSTSGKAYGVTETPLNAYYQGRFMRAIRVFDQNN